MDEANVPVTPARLDLRRKDLTIYQIYPMSFQDSNGDGKGDLKGITSRIGYLKQLGVDAIWLSPIFASPQVDFGYDISDFCTIDPIYGSNADFEELIAEAHARGVGVLLDFVPCHTSIKHRWFREHPEWYFFREGRENGEAPPNNWKSKFGGSAWTKDKKSGKWYLHTHYPQQPDLNWRHPGVVLAMTGILRYWADQGVDGFRLDVVANLYKDSEFRDEPVSNRTTRKSVTRRYDRLEHIYTSDLPEVQDGLGLMRRAVPECVLLGEVSRSVRWLGAYLRELDLVFAFDFLAAPLDVGILRQIIESGVQLNGLAWVMANHDSPRLTSRWGSDLARCAAMLLLTLPGAAVIYQGDEIGMKDGETMKGGFDRYGRDRFRHPMQWTPEGGYSTGTPWLPLIDPQVRNVADQEGLPTSMLALYRNLLAFRKNLKGEFSMEIAANHILQYRRGEHRVVLNMGEEEIRLPEGEAILGTAEMHLADPSSVKGILPGRAGVIMRVPQALEMPEGGRDTQLRT